MSWSFSITENTKADALRVFDNKLVEHSLISAHVRGQLSDAAKNLADTLPSTGHRITISTSGGIGKTLDGKPDNTGNITVSLLYTPAPEDIPNHKRE